MKVECILIRKLNNCSGNGRLRAITAQNTDLHRKNLRNQRNQRENKKFSKLKTAPFKAHILHAGHVRMLAEARAQCDYLIVGLQTDPTIDRPEKNKPTQTVVERYIQLKGCRYVDEIIPYTTEKDLEDILQLYSIDVRIVGSEYKDKDFTGREYCNENNIVLYFNERRHRFSSTNLRKEIYRMENQKAQENIPELNGVHRKALS